MIRPRSAARGLLVRGDELLMIQYRTDDEDWYVIPGGGQQCGESLAEMIHREVYKETGYEVAVRSLAYARDFVPSTHYENRDDGHQANHFFWCERVGDEPDDPTERDSVQVDVRWLPLDELGEVRPFPGPLGGRLRSGNPDEMGDARGAAYLGDTD